MIRKRCASRVGTESRTQGYPKVFSHRFNAELAAQGYPTEFTEKKYAIIKAFDVSGYLATSMIFGHELPDRDTLDTISEVLHVCPLWLTGVTDKKKAYSGRSSKEVEDTEH